MSIRKMYALIILFSSAFLFISGCTSLPLAPGLFKPGSANLPPATLTKEPLYWDVDILQNGKYLAANNNQVTLKREPFTIQVKLPILITVFLNVFDKDTNYRQIIPGYLLSSGYDDCVIAFCPAMGIAEDDRSTSLFIDLKATHWWYYGNDTSNRGSRFSINGNQVTLERDVKFLAKRSKSSSDQKPISETSYKQLYLIFVVQHGGDHIIDDDEMRKLILFFQ